MCDEGIDARGQGLCVFMDGRSDAIPEKTWDAANGVSAQSCVLQSCTLSPRPALHHTLED